MSSVEYEAIESLKGSDAMPGSLIAGLIGGALVGLFGYRKGLRDGVAVRSGKLLGFVSSDQHGIAFYVDGIRTDAGNLPFKVRKAVLRALEAL